jgi:hypothetical protein
VSTNQRVSDEDLDRLGRWILALLADDDLRFVVLAVTVAVLTMFGL